VLRTAAPHTFVRALRTSEQGMRKSRQALRIALALVQRTLVEHMLALAWLLILL